MPKAVIFANGRMEIPPWFNFDLEPAPRIIAADGGTKNCRIFGAEADVIIGDLDSMQPDEISGYKAAGIQILQYPTHKDQTDLELALEYAYKDGLSDVIILGALGARWDMTIANILLVAHPIFRSLHIRIIDGTQELSLLKPEIANDIHGKPGDTVSLIPLSGDVAEIETTGLEYQLNRENLRFGATEGISNVLIQERAQVSFRNGLLLCVVNRMKSDNAP